MQLDSFAKAGLCFWLREEVGEASEELIDLLEVVLLHCLLLSILPFLRKGRVKLSSKLVVHCTLHSTYGYDPYTSYSISL